MAVDETYLKLGGRSCYLYRGIDEQGQIVDVYLSDRRQAAAPHTFFQQAIYANGVTLTRLTSDTGKSYLKALD